MLCMRDGLPTYRVRVHHCHIDCRTRESMSTQPASPACVTSRMCTAGRATRRAGVQMPALVVAVQQACHASARPRQGPNAGSMLLAASCLFACIDGCSMICMQGELSNSASDAPPQSTPCSKQVGMNLELLHTDVFRRDHKLLTLHACCHSGRWGSASADAKHQGQCRLIWWTPECAEDDTCHRPAQLRVRLDADDWCVFGDLSCDRARCDTALGSEMFDLLLQAFQQASGSSVSTSRCDHASATAEGVR